MTLLDKSKLKRILTQANLMDQIVSITGMLAEAQAIWNAAQAEQREADAQLCERYMRGDGELNEYWLHGMAAAIRNKK